MQCCHLLFIIVNKKVGENLSIQNIKSINCIKKCVPIKLYKNNYNLLPWYLLQIFDYIFMNQIFFIFVECVI